MNKKSAVSNPTYIGRMQEQLEEWVDGNPIHNQVEDECTPDFSCCNPDLLQSPEERKQFYNKIQEQL